MTGAEQTSLWPGSSHYKLEIIANVNFRRHGRWLMADWWRFLFGVTTFILVPFSLSADTRGGKYGVAAWKKPSHQRSSSRNGSASLKETESNRGTSWLLKSPAAWRWLACTNTLACWAVVTYRQGHPLSTPHPHTHRHVPHRKSLNSASALLCISEEAEKNATAQQVTGCYC